MFLPSKYAHEMGAKKFIAICDNGFEKASNQTIMEATGLPYLAPLWRNSAKKDFNTTDMHSSETQEACLFLNHLSIMMVYCVYNVLRKNGALKKFATVKMRKAYLWDIRITNMGNT